MSPVARHALRVDDERLLARLAELGEIGKQQAGGRTRLALTDEDKQARDLIVTWIEQTGARACVDHIGNVYGIAEGDLPGPSVMTGSHIDTVKRAGAYDGCYGVVAGIEVLHALREQRNRRRVIAAAFTNEEGVRFAPDLLGSRVVAGNVALRDALNVRAPDGVTVGDELRRIGYAGELSPSELVPGAFLELHIEQGPLLHAQDIAIGVVQAVNGHSWWRVTVEGTANHAGTTPMGMRRDAGAAAMTLAARLIDSASQRGVPDVATVGSIAFEPNAINVVPGRAVFTIDFRAERASVLGAAEQVLDDGLRTLADAGFRVAAERISQSAPVHFDPRLSDLVESLAVSRGLSTCRMSSGASHDAQMMAGVCPTAMIFVPSHLGISHNPNEHTVPQALVAGADLLLQAVMQLASPPGGHDGSESI